MSDTPYATLYSADDETMFVDLPSCYESTISPYYEPGEKVPTITEWEAVPLAEYVSLGGEMDWAVERLIENITEEADDDRGSLSERLWKRYEEPATRAMFQAALEDLLSVASGWSVAHRERRTIAITWGDDGEPLADGSPIYGSAS